MRRRSLLAAACACAALFLLLPAHLGQQFGQALADSKRALARDIAGQVLAEAGVAPAARSELIQLSSEGEHEIVDGLVVYEELLPVAQDTL